MLKLCAHSSYTEAKPEFRMRDNVEANKRLLQLNIPQKWPIAECTLWKNLCRPSTRS